MKARRRICWPDPDATCLEGGCLYCNENPFRTIESIRNWASTRGLIMGRYGNERKDAMVAFDYGESHHWGNADWRRGT